MAEPICEELLEADGSPLRYFPAAPIKREYVLFTDPDMFDEQRLTWLMSQSISYVTDR